MYIFMDRFNVKIRLSNGRQILLLEVTLDYLGRYLPSIDQNFPGAKIIAAKHI